MVSAVSLASCLTFSVEDLTFSVILPVPVEAIDVTFNLLNSPSSSLTLLVSSVISAVAAPTFNPPEKAVFNSIADLEISSNLITIWFRLEIISVNSALLPNKSCKPLLL